MLQVANMPDEERREYRRFVEVLSDRASIAMTIEFESNLKAEEKAKVIAEKMASEMAEKMKGVVINMLKIGNMKEEQIAEIAQVSVEFVKAVAKEIR